MISTGEAPVPRKHAPPKPLPPTTRRVRFGPPGVDMMPPLVIEDVKPVKTKREKAKADPTHIAKARELRDRYLEQFNSGVLADGTQILPQGKYEVSRLASPQTGMSVPPSKLLAQAA
jgi:hypothetical protein